MLKRKTRNKFEQRIERSLRKSKVKFSYETERIPYILARHYLPDFIIETPTGKIYLETKGYLRREDKSKLVAVKKCNPRVDLRILFYSSNKAYIKWAVKNNIRYAIETIPSEWLRGL